MSLHSVDDKRAAVAQASEADADWQDRLDTTDKGAVRAHVGNLRLILAHDPRWDGVLGYCDFSYRIIKLRAPPTPNGAAGEWEDADTSALRVWFNEQYGVNPARGDVVDALVVCSRGRRFHPVREYLNGLEWDGSERLEHLLEDFFGAMDDRAYLAQVGIKFMVGSVARVMEPGCKMDNVLILEGRQGRGKSSAIRILYGDWFSDAPLPLGEKDAYQSIQGVWCAEMAELDAFNKAETTSSKLFFSQRRDRYRPSYGHMAQDFPRQCVFIGTTNQDEYLKDYSGNRRYWPVRCHEIRLDLLQEYRDQLWAEAVQRYRQKERWWIDSQEQQALFESRQDDRMMRDPWEEAVVRFVESTTVEHYSAYELLTEAIKLDAAHIQRAHQNRLSPIMKALGWERRRKWVEGRHGKRVYVYQRPSEYGRKV